MKIRLLLLCLKVEDIMEKTIIDILTNSIGAVAVAAIFLVYLDRNDKRNNELIGNHLKHSTDAMLQMSNALTKLVSTIDSLKRFIKNSSKR